MQAVPPDVRHVHSVAASALISATNDAADGARVSVTGPLEQTAADYQLHIRLFHMAD